MYSVCVCVCVCVCAHAHGLDLSVGASCKNEAHGTGLHGPVEPEEVLDGVARPGLVLLQQVE